MDVTAELDRLYSLPLEDFTSARNRLADELKRTGSPEDAKQVGVLKKPVVSAWTVNQLARRERPTMEALVASASEIEEAKGPGELRSAGAERKRHVAALLRAARAILEEAGHNASATTIDKISNTLLAGTGEDARAMLLEGRLSEDLEVSGLGAWGFAGAETGAVTVEDLDAGSDRREEARRRAEELAQTADAEERAAREAARALANAQAALERAEKAGQAATRRAEEARRRADEALEDL